MSKSHGTIHVTKSAYMKTKRIKNETLYLREYLDDILRHIIHVKMLLLETYVDACIAYII